MKHINEEFEISYPEEGMDVPESEFKKLLDHVLEGQKILKFPVLDHIDFLGQLAWAPRYSASESAKYNISNYDFYKSSLYWYLCHANKMLRVYGILLKKNNIEITMDDMKKLYWFMEECEAEVEHSMLYYRSVILGEDVDFYNELD